MTHYNVHLTLPTEPSTPMNQGLLPTCDSRELTGAAKAKRKVQEKA